MEGPDFHNSVRTPDIPDERRGELLETAELIRAYLQLWEMEQALAVQAAQRAEGLI